MLIEIEDEDDAEMMRAPGVVAWLREIEARGEAKGEAKGEARGEEKAITEFFGRLFARRVGRQPTEDESRSIVERSRAIGAAEVEDALFDLDREVLVRWLAEPVRRS